MSFLGRITLLEPEAEVVPCKAAERTVGSLSQRVAGVVVVSLLLVVLDSKCFAQATLIVYFSFK